MPKIVDRSRWILLDKGQEQAGWLEQSDTTMFRCFRTWWRTPDGCENYWKKRVALGPESMAKKAARTKLRDEIKRFDEVRLTPTHYHRPEPDTRFEWLLERVKATREGEWKPTTKSVNEMYLRVLRNKLGGIPVDQFGTIEMQDHLREWLQQLTREGYSKSYIQHTLIYLWAALNEAVKRKLVHFNYASELKVPKATKAADQRFVTDEEVAAIVQHFHSAGQKRDALIVEILFLCALRPAELFALNWNDWDPARLGELRIDENFGKGGLLTPKTERSRATISVPPRVQHQLTEWKRWCGNATPDAFMFPSGRGTAIRY
jgi:integrase